MAEKTVPVSTDQQGEAPATREESRYLVPPVDIYEEEEGLVVVADLPGADRDSLDVRVDDGILTIRAKPCCETKGSAMLEEFGLIDYFRQFELSDAVDQEKIAAEYKHGVLTLRLPKAEKAKPRQISVDVG